MTADTDDHAWLEWRRGGIGGSDIGALLGLSTFASPWSLWADKVGLIPPSETTERQRIGHRMETVLAGEYYDRTGLIVAAQQKWCTHPEYPWARCTIDGFATDPNAGSDEPVAVVEFKTDARRNWADGVPPGIRAQCIWQMGVTGVHHAHLVVMHAGFNVDVHDIDWDQADWEFMLDRANRFWTEHVVTGTPPPVDGTNATDDAIAAVWPTHQPDATVDVDRALVADLAEGQT